jgi:hypothetical protein
MGAPDLPHRTVEDAAIDLIEAAGRLTQARDETARVMAMIEARWAANREHRSGCHGKRLPGM